MRKLACVLALFSFMAISQADEVKLKISGMVCQKGCVGKVNKALSNVPGVTEKKVEVGAAVITFDAAKAKKSDIVAAIEKVGFTVEK